jgi:hypothetical protein
VSEAREAAEAAREAAREASNLVREARDLVKQASDIITGQRNPPSPEALTTADEPRWMRDGPDQLPTEMSMEKVRSTLDWQFDGFWERPIEEQKTLYWAMRLLDQAREDGLAQRIRGFRYFSAGFLDDPRPAEEASEDPTFGLIAVVAPSTSAETPSHDENAESELPRRIPVDRHSFPIRVRHQVDVLHAPRTQPYGGSATCWAVARASRDRIGPGLLTAKHVVADMVADSVRLSDGTSGRILDLAPDGIDAAIVATGEQPGNRTLPVQRLVAPWTDVEFSGSVTGLHRTKVKDMTDTRGIFSSPYLPCRVFLGDYGQRGDSGALIRDATTGEAIGIYMGEAQDPVGTREGIAQHMYQVQLVMDLELCE